jgi:thiol-disulfide isomerase/thioredoxin
MTKIIAIAVLLVGMLAGGYLLRQKLTQSDAPPVAQVTEKDRLNFTLPDLDGVPRQLSEWDGKSRIVNFWATWCAPCRREIPLLKQTQEEHATNNLQIIGIAVDFPEEVAAYAEEAQFNYPILVGQEDAMAAAEASGIEFIGMPFTLIISAEGELLKAHMGEIVESHIQTILSVFAQLESGDLDTAAARDALSHL